MRFIVDEYPIYRDSCPFFKCSRYVGEGTCKITHDECPKCYEGNSECALISYEDFIAEQKQRND